MMSADMNIFNAFIAFLCILSISVEFCHGSVSVTRVLNVRDNMTLDCVTDWDPDIDMHWLLRKNGSDQYLAHAGKSYPNGKIYEESRYDPRISFSFVNISSDTMNMNLALSISNIIKQDSAEYICYSSRGSVTLNIYNIRVVTRKCSIDMPNTFLPSQPRQSSTRGTTRIIDHTNEPSSSHELLSTLVKSLQYTKSITVSPQSGSQRSLRSSSSEMASLETSSSLIPSPPRTTETIEIQATSFTKMQEQTDSTTITKCSKSPLAINESKTTLSACSSSPSQPASTVRTSILSTEAQPRPTPSQQYASPSTLTLTSSLETSSASSSSPSQPASTVRTSILSTEAQPRPTLSQQTASPSTLTHTAPLTKSSTTDMTSKPNTKRPSEFSPPKPEKTSKSSLATLSTTLPTNQKTIKNIIIPLSVSVSAGVIFMAVIILMTFRRRYYKSSNVGGSNKFRKVRAKSTGKRLQTLSTTIPDFNFQPSAMKTCRLNDEESSHGHYPPAVDFHTQQAMSTNTLNSLEVERSDSRMALSDKGSTRNVMHASAVIPMKELKDSHGQDNPDDNLYFVLENDSTNYSPNGNPCTPSCVKPHQIKGAGYEPSNNKCEASDESMFVDNILYESSDAVTMAMKGKQGQNTDEANLYFVLENDNLYSPPPPFDSHLEEDSDAGPSGHQYEDIDFTRKLVEGGARCSTPMYAMPDELSKTTDSRMNACGKGYPLDTMKGVNDTSSASMASESTVDVGPLYAQID